MKAIEQYFSVKLFVMLYKVVVTFESMYQIPRYDEENYLELIGELSVGVLLMKSPIRAVFNIKNTFMWYCLFCSKVYHITYNYGL